MSVDRDQSAAGCFLNNAAIFLHVDKNAAGNQIMHLRAAVKP